jgi:hypothetical protein
MALKELQKKVIEFRDARDWEQLNQMAEDGGERSEVRGQKKTINRDIRGAEISGRPYSTWR